ncbi:MAG: prepilin-type N-terminal cleavage/methylation domain-containing protein [Abditibacteriota bacterium]|nr:prepilin-type N-terminal cleavage/methylation domain-containing protein [Abditibacteriota bacterium]
MISKLMFLISKIKNQSKKGFTLIELLVVIAIIAILAAILFPVFAQAREKARQASCLSNMKQLGTAVQLYVDDYDETFMPVLGQPQNWPQYIHGNKAGYNLPYPLLCANPYIKNYKMFDCPSAVDNQSTFKDAFWIPTGEKMAVNIGVNWHIADKGNYENNGAYSLSEITSSSSMILLFDGLPCVALSEYWWPNYVWVRHNGNMNVCFCDGHAKTIRTMGTNPNDIAYKNWPYRDNGYDMSTPYRVDPARQ